MLKSKEDFNLHDLHGFFIAGGKEYDYAEWCYMIAYEQMTVTRGLKCVLFVGGTGSGKSTSIGLLLGARYQFDPETKQFLLKYSPKGTPATSDNALSKTLHISPWTNDKEETYCDSAGLGENRGTNKWLWTMNNLNVFLNTVGSLRAIVVTLDYRQLEVQRAESLRSVVQQLLPLVSVPGGVKECTWLFESMIFLISFASVEGTYLSDIDVKKAFGKRLQVFKDSKDKFIAKMKKKYDSKAVGVANAAIASIGGGQIDSTGWEAKLNDEEERTLLELMLLVRIVEEITTPSSRVVVANIRDPKECEATKTRLEEAIKATPPLKREDVRTLGTGPHGISKNAGRDFAYVLSAMCQRVLPLLRKKHQLVSDLHDRLKKNEGQLQAIERDYKAVLRSLSNDKKSKENELIANIRTAKTDLKDLQTSETLLELRRETVWKERSSAVFSWVVLGGGWAEYEFTYDGHPYANYILNGSTLDEKKCHSTHEEPQKGKLRMKLESKRGYDLSASIVFMIQKKRHPDIIVQAKNLENHILGLEKELKQVKNDLISLATIKSKEALMSFVDKGLELVKKNVRELETRFQDVIVSSEPTQITVAQYLVQLNALIELLRSSKLLSTDLPVEVQAHVVEFVGVTNKIKDILQTFAGSILKNELLPVPERLKNNEMQAPHLPFHSQILNGVMGRAMNLRDDVSRFLGQYRGLVGLALLMTLFFGRSGVHSTIFFGAMIMLLLGMWSVILALADAASKQKEEMRDLALKAMDEVVRQVTLTRWMPETFWKMFQDDLRRSLTWIFAQILILSEVHLYESHLLKNFRLLENCFRCSNRK